MGWARLEGVKLRENLNGKGCGARKITAASLCSAPFKDKCEEIEEAMMGGTKRIKRDAQITLERWIIDQAREALAKARARKQGSPTLDWDEVQPLALALARSGQMDEPLFGGQSLLEFSCAEMTPRSTREALGLGANPNARSGADAESLGVLCMRPDRAQALHAEAPPPERDAVEKIQALIDSGWNVEQQDASGKRALHQACATRRGRVVALLLGAGASVSCSDVNGWTPLHEAAKSQWGEGVQMLLGAGADANALVKTRGLSGAMEFTPAQVARKWMPPGYPCPVAELLKAWEERQALDGAALPSARGDKRRI